ncbi:phage tail tape measure protein [Pseudomonas paralactis]|uniref:phage tail tape measure protein n=1 Tax=Pseudomonas paralactis TaxID=1615673 RepID=UPI00164708DD|nr:phage tail tape measure protein [Pseudomonas paralactis]MBC3258057.1 phage tail tape measure protein [Pseudomonas paralactis]
MANDLRLQVLLSAIDKTTGPLKQITGGSQETARALKAARDRLKELNTQQRDVSAWRELQAETRATSEALAANNAKVGELSRVTAKVRQQLAPTQALFEQSRHKVDALKTSQHELKRELTGARNALGLLGDEHRKSGNQIAALNAVVQKGNALTREQLAEYTRLTAAQRDRKAQLDQLATKEKTLADRFTLNNAQLRTSRAGHASLRDEIRRLEAPFKAQLTLLKQHSTESKRLGELYGQQQNKLSSLGARLKNVGINTNALGASELRLKRDMDNTTRAMKAQMDKLDALRHKQESLAKVRDAYGQGKQFAGSAAVAGGASLGVAYTASRPVISVVKEYVDFESAMMGVAKQVDGARDSNGKLTSTYYEFAAAIKAASNEMPIATTEFAALVEAQARAGIQGKENLLAMAKVSATAAVAFDLPAEQVGEDMGRIAGLYKVPIKNIAELGDALNYLDDNTRSKGGDIIETLTRMSDVADKLDYRKAAALGSTFLSLGSAPEVAASASRAMVRELAIATMQGKKFQEGMAMVGLDSKAVQTGMTKDAMSTMMGVLERIKKLSPEQQTEASTRLFGKEFGKDAGKLVNNLDELRRQLKLVDDAAAKGSMQREMDVRADAIEGRWQVLQNKLFNTKSGAGEAVRATMVDVMDAIGGVLDKVNGWVQANPVLTATLLKIVASVAALSAVFGGLALTLGGILAPFLFLRFGLAMLGIRLPGIIAVLKVFGTVMRALGGILIGPLVSALRVVGIALWGLSANPIVLVIAAVVAALAGGAYMIYKNWDAVKNYFANAWTEIKAGFSGGIGGIINTLANFSPIGLIYQAFAGVLSYLGVDLPSRFTEFGNMIVNGLINGLTAGLSGVKNAIGSIGDASIGWFKEKLGIHSPSRVFAELGGFTMAGLTQGLEGGENGPLKALTQISEKLTAAGSVVLSVPAQPEPVAVKEARQRTQKLPQPLLSIESVDTEDARERTQYLPQLKLPVPPVGAEAARQHTRELPQALLPLLPIGAENARERTQHLLQPELPATPIEAEEARQRIQHIPQLPLRSTAQAPKQTPPINEGLVSLMDLGKQIAAAGALAMSAFSLPALAVDDRPPIASAPVKAVYDSHDVININIPATPGLDAQAVARAVRAELVRIDREKKARNRSKLSDRD